MDDPNPNQNQDDQGGADITIGGYKPSKSSNTGSGSDDSQQKPKKRRRRRPKKKPKTDNQQSGQVKDDNKNDNNKSGKQEQQKTPKTDKKQSSQVKSDNKNDENDSQSVQDQSQETQKPKKKRRRRPRKKKQPVKEQVNEEVEDEIVFPEDLSEKRKKEEVSEKSEIPFDVEEPIEAPNAEISEDSDDFAFPIDDSGVISETDETEQEASVEPPLPEIPQAEEAKVVEPSFPADLPKPEVEKKPEEPSPFVGGGDTSGPSSWDDIKAGIKADHTEKEIELNQPIVQPSTPQMSEDSMGTATEGPKVEELPQETSEITPQPGIPTPIIGAVVSETGGNAPSQTDSVPEQVNNGTNDVAPVIETQEQEIKDKEEEIANKILSTVNEEVDDEEHNEILGLVFKYLAFGCAIIVLIVLVFVFKLHTRVIDFVKNIGAEQEVEQTVEPTEGPNIDSAETDIQISFVVGKNQIFKTDQFEEGVGISYVIGNTPDVSYKLDPAIGLSFSIGKTVEVKEPKYKEIISPYMHVLSRLQNAFGTDLHALLDKSSNRGSVLQAHLRELKVVQKEAVDALEEINVKKDELKIQFNDLTEKKDNLELDFFAATENLESSKANFLLNEFIIVSQKQIDVKSQFNGLNKVSQLFEVAIENMALRIKDIEFNKEALTEGIKVINIQGSDLDLIIQESEIE